MIICEWCGKESAVMKHIDGVGNEHKICRKCMTRLSNGKCQRCGKSINKFEAVNGKCSACYQLEIRERALAREEEEMGVSEDVLDFKIEKSKMTDEQYSEMLALGTDKNMQNLLQSKVAKRMWIMVKFNEAGIYDNDTISKHFKDVESMMIRSMDKLVNNPCELVIDSRKLNGKTIIDSENGAFLVR